MNHSIHIRSDDDGGDNNDGDDGVGKAEASQESPPLLCIRKCNKFAPQKADPDTCFCGRPRSLHLQMQQDNAGVLRTWLDAR